MSKINNVKSTGRGQSEIYYNDGRSVLTMDTMTATNSLAQTHVSSGQKRQACNEFILDTKCNGTLAFGGNSQINTSGFHLDVGSPELHTGIPQRQANSFNKELYAFLAQPTDDSNTTEPKLLQLPSLSDMLGELNNFTPDTSGKGIPPMGSVSSMSDLQKWIVQFSAWCADQMSFLDMEKQKAAVTARISDGEEQNKLAKEQLEKKYGQTLTMTLFGTQLANPLTPISLDKSEKELNFTRSREQLIRAADPGGGRNQALSKLG